ALIDAPASKRRVLTCDNAGVGGSTGSTPITVEQMANDAFAFITVLDLAQVDLLLHRQFRGPADRVDQARSPAAADPSVRGAARRGRHAWVGAGGHRRCRQPA